jgi:hypothetical protein
VALCGLVGATRVASAADIDVISVEENVGPSKTIPTDAAFYLSGRVDPKVVRVQILIVRTGSPYIGGNHGESCDAVIAHTKQFAGGDGTRLPELLGGTRRADEIWRGADRGWSVRVSQPWTPLPADGKPPEFKLLIEKDTGFFSAGHAYCFFIYKDTREAHQDLALAHEVLQSIEKYAQCLTDKGEDRCSIDRSQREALVAKIDPSAREDARVKIEASQPVAFDLYQNALRIDALLASWSSAARRTTVAPDADTSAGIGKASLALLQKAHKIAASAAPPRVDLNLAQDLIVPTTALSIHDLLGFAAGWIPLDHSLVAPDQLRATLAPIFEHARAATPLTNDETKFLAATRAALTDLRSALNAIRFGPPTRDPVLVDLQTWAIADAFVPCADQNRAIWKLPGLACRPEFPWGYDDESDPVSLLALELDSFAKAQVSWLSDRPAIESAVITTRLYSQPFETKIEMTREVWVFSYLSPVIGYAVTVADRAGKSEAITLNYYGVQLHVLPNPSHSPQADLGILALELGASPGIGSFGPDNRFRGYKGIAPLMIGLAFHPIPFTSISAGLLLADYRSTTLAQESYRTFMGTYIALSVDFNIPELIRSQTSKASSTTVTKN